MEDKTGYEAASEASPSSSRSDRSLTERKKPCQICGSDANQDRILTCILCRETREHTYCARGMLRAVPPIMWICEECRSSGPVVTISSRPNRVVANEESNNQTATSSRTNRVVASEESNYQTADSDIVRQNMSTSNSVNQILASEQTGATSSRTTYQVVDSEIVHHNMTTSNSGSQDSAAHQPSQAHASPECNEEASSPVPPMDASAVKLPDSNLFSDSESAV